MTGTKLDMLLDTHIWIRWQLNDLPGHLSELINQADRLAVSSITCWELGQLVKKNRIELTLPVKQWVDEALKPDINVLPLTREVALLAAELPEHHRDPADRIIIATAILNKLKLVSLDTKFPLYSELEGLLIAK